MGLYHAILNFEKAYPFFNKKFLTPDMLLDWMEKLGYTPLEDRTINTFLLMPKEKVVLYNPYFHPDELVVGLGHEIGHILLGHADYADIFFSNRTYFLKSGLEKDAGIIGFLCWIPTWFLEKMEKEERLNLEELISELKTCDTEEELLFKLCRARLRIYKAWKYLRNFNK